MKKISLKKLSMNNFKGIKSLDIDFDKDRTNILGDNGTGKTTVFDGFTFLLFGKDHNDNAKFEIKTLDSSNKAIPKLIHSVEAELLVDEEIIRIKRSYKEKWVKKKGSAEAVLTGHETAYFYNDVPVTLTEFGDKMKSLIEEPIFKLITNPFYFNDLPWLSRRMILTEIANIISDEEIANENPDFIKLFDEMSGKSFEDFKRIINASKNKVKTQLDEIPTRIDELYKSLPESEDFKGIKKDIKNKNIEIDKIVKQIIDSSKVDEEHATNIKVKQRTLSEFENQKISFENGARTSHSNNKSEFQGRVNDQERLIQSAKFDVERIDRKIENDISQRRKYESEIVDLRKEFDTVQATEIVIDENQFSCPTCKRDFIQVDIELKRSEMTANFNTDKANKLEDINTKGRGIKTNFEKAKQSVIDAEAEKVKADKKLKSLISEKTGLQALPILSIEEQLDTDDYKSCLKSIEDTKKEIEDLRNSAVKVDLNLIKTLESDKTTLKEEINVLAKSLYKEDQIKNGNIRIAKLEEQSTLYAQELAELEGKEFMIDKFNTEKMNRIEDAINGLFPTVNFKMFSHQLNGGVSECCETLINGVPFDNANNAAKIQSGIEIINVLSAYHQYSAPIFVDNAESIVKLPFTSSQLITLIVSENHKSLTIN